MLSKLTMSLAVATSLLLTNSAFAQQTAAQKATAQKAKEAKEATAQKAKEADLAAEKALEQARLTEAQAALAQESTGVLGYVKSHFKASYYGEFTFTRREIESDNKEDHKIQDLNIMHNPAISYTFFPNYKLAVSSEFKYSDMDGKESFINRHYRSLVTLTRENILTEADNGIGMNMALVRRVMDRNHGEAGSYGNSRINTTLSKKFGDKLSTSLILQYLRNDPVKSKVKASTWKHAYNPIPSITYQITDKLSYLFNDDINIYTPRTKNNDRNVNISHDMNLVFLSYDIDDKNSPYFQFKYLHSERTPFQTAGGAADWFEYYIGHAYNVTPKFNVTAEMGSKIFGPNDGRDFFAKDVQYPEFALFLSYSL